MPHVTEDPETEYVYTVEIRRPLYAECDDADPEQCRHDGTDEDAITYLESELTANMPPTWYVHVRGREVYLPPPAELLMRVEGAIDTVKRHRQAPEQRDFTRLIYWTRLMQEQRRHFTEEQRRKADTLRRRVRRTIGL